MTSETAIAAGMTKLNEHLGTCDPGLLFNRREVVLAIYEAMSAVEPPPKSTPNLTLKLDTGDLQVALAQFSMDIASFKALVESAEAAIP